MKIKMIKGFTVINGKSYDNTTGSFDVDDATGKRFVALGVAVAGDSDTTVTDNPSVNAIENQNTENNGSGEKKLEEMKLDELRNLAKEMGLDISSTKKADFIQAINAKQAEPETEENIVNDGEPAPTFNAEGSIQ